ncbi:hypothetical protein [Geodermatophilus sp. SYSU D00815]
MTPSWFPGPDGDPFLTALRAEVARTGLRDVEPAATHVHTGGDGLAVCAVVPGVSDADADVALRLDRVDGSLAGRWTDECHDPDAGAALREIAAERSPEDAARRAVPWLLEQLARPVERLEWTARGRPQVQWRFADTGERLWGHDLRGRFGRTIEPERVVRLR